MPFYNFNDYIKLIRPLPDYVERDIFGIPFIDEQEIDLSGLNNSKWLINMNKINPSDTNANKKIVHSFCYDDDLYKAYNKPFDFLQRVSKYYAVASFDFSMYDVMDFRHILASVYDNRWIGAFLQSYGKKVIATVGWTSEQYDNICFAGLKNDATFMISTLGVNNEECKSAFLRGYFVMRKKFPDSKIICVGDPIEGMDNDVFYVRYKESFGNWEKYPGFWQLSFLNADGSIYIGGEL